MAIGKMYSDEALQSIAAEKKLIARIEKIMLFDTG